MGDNLCCTGVNQSPININMGKAEKCDSTNCNLTFYYKDSKECKIHNDSYGIWIEYPKNSNIIYNNTVYTLRSALFVDPNAHRFNNDVTPYVELQLLHYNYNSTEPLTISVMIRKSNKTKSISLNSKFFDMFLHDLPKDTSETGAKIIDMAGKNWNIFFGLPLNKDFYTYEQGSGTQIGECEENVKWIILKNPVMINTTAWAKLTERTKIHKNKSKPLKKNNSKVYFVKNPNKFNFTYETDLLKKSSNNQNLLSSNTTTTKSNNKINNITPTVTTVTTVTTVGIKKEKDAIVTTLSGDVNKSDIVSNSVSTKPSDDDKKEKKEKDDTKPKKPAKKSNNVLFGILIALFVLVVIGAIVYFVLNSKKAATPKIVPKKFGKLNVSKLSSKPFKGVKNFGKIKLAKDLSKGLNLKSKGLGKGLNLKSKGLGKGFKGLGKVPKIPLKK